MSEERFMDGRLVEIAITPAEHRWVREYTGTLRAENAGLRKLVRTLEKLIASEDFSGDAALTLIRNAIGDGQ